MTYTDTGLSPNTTYQYRIRAQDPDGNVADSSTISVTTSGGAAGQDAYATQVLTDGPTNYWRLGENSGPSTDRAGSTNLALGSGVTRNVAGAITGAADGAMTFNGNSSGTGYSQALTTPPAAFSLEAWFKTSSSRGGKILGFGSSPSGLSGNNDRHLYLDNAGRLTFGVYPGAVRTLRSAAAYNNGQWHYAVATLSSQGMALYVDGVSVGSDPSTQAAQVYNGYWRVGGDTVSGWPNAPTSAYLNGTIDEVAIYAKALTAAQVRTHFTRSGRTL